MMDMVRKTHLFFDRQEDEEYARLAKQVLQAKQVEASIRPAWLAPEVESCTFCEKPLEEERCANFECWAYNLLIPLPVMRCPERPAPTNPTRRERR